MKTARLLFVPLLASVGLLAPAASLEAREDPWIHVEVEDDDRSEVRVSLPLAAVSLAAALIPSGVKVGADISVDGSEVDWVEVARVWKRLRNRPEMTYVTVSERDGGRVRLARSKGKLLLQVEDGADRVEMRMPAAAVDVLFARVSNDRTELDVAGMLRVIASTKAGEILAVSGKDQVRIWVGPKLD